MSDTGLVQILEGALMAAGEPLSLQRMAQLFDDLERPSNDELREALDGVGQRCEGRGYELKQVASGYRFQVRQSLSTWIGRLWQERPQKYSRALLETLSLIAYRQPITRGEIEEIRGVAVSSNIIKTLQERDWVRIVGHRDVPGRPAMYATTRQFLDYFNLKSLEELPPLAEIKELDNLSGDLQLEVPPMPEPAPESPDVGDRAGGAEVAADPASLPENGVADTSDPVASEAAQDVEIDPLDADENPSVIDPNDMDADSEHQDYPDGAQPSDLEGEPRGV